MEQNYGTYTAVVTLQGNYSGTFTKTFTLNDPAAINGVKATDADSNAAWYTIDGRRLNGTPTQRGIYIRDGKKVVRK